MEITPDEKKIKGYLIDRQNKKCWKEKLSQQGGWCLGLEWGMGGQLFLLGVKKGLSEKAADI